MSSIGGRSLFVEITPTHSRRYRSKCESIWIGFFPLFVDRIYIRRVTWPGFNMGSGLSREHSVKSAVKSSPRQRRPKGSLHSLMETDDEGEAGDEGCDCDCCREECDCVSEDGHMNTLETDRQERKLRCLAVEAESS